MKQSVQPEGLTPNPAFNCSTEAWAALLTGLLAVCRGRERGEPYWALDVRRAQARVHALRVQSRRAVKPLV